MSVSTSPVLPVTSIITYTPPTFGQPLQAPSVNLKWNDEVKKYFAHVTHGHCSTLDIFADLVNMQTSGSSGDKVKNCLYELETCILDLTLMKEAAASSQYLSKELIAAINTAIESDQQMKAFILARLTSH